MCNLSIADPDRRRCAAVRLVETAVCCRRSILPVFGARIPLGQMDLVSTQTDQLRKIGDSLFETQADLSPAGRNLQVKQGFIEASGVNPILEMTAMIETSRAFEANINMIRIQDESLGRLLQTVGG